MHNKQSTQSVKDIIEDIRAMFGNNTNDSKSSKHNHAKGNDHKVKKEYL